MAEKLGVTQQYYSKLESEKTDVPFSKIEQLAEIFEIKPENTRNYVNLTWISTPLGSSSLDNASTVFWVGV